ncbi:hypothetical protein RSW31_26140, partial [Escherichia coli]|uniref:hypothetical protein n=1 Tax=Escherichia coli TaxID=562 RepID=UPI0028DF8F4D
MQGEGSVGSGEVGLLSQPVTHLRQAFCLPPLAGEGQGLIDLRNLQHPFRLGQMQPLDHLPV